jgi:RNA methyltransferase, TrmH family
MAGNDTGSTRAVIRSPANDKLKHARRLRRSRHRASDHAFLIEGYRELARAVEGGIAVRDLFICPELWTGRNEQGLTDLIESRHGRISVLTEKAFSSLAGQETPDGVLGIAEIPDVGLDRQAAAFTASGQPLFLVVEGIERPGNLGTIARTCAGTGVNGLIVCDPQVDPFHPEVVRASVGALFALRLSVVSTPEFLVWARDRAVRLVVSTPAAKSSYDRAVVTGTTALVVGSEKSGVTDDLLDAADELVSLPMSGGVDSVNVAVAAGVLVFDALRQRAGREESGDAMSRVALGPDELDGGTR